MSLNVVLEVFTFMLYVLLEFIVQSLAYDCSVEEDHITESPTQPLHQQVIEYACWPAAATPTNKA